MKRYCAWPLVAVIGLLTLSSSLVSVTAGESPAPGTITTVAGTGTPGSSGDGGPATQAQLQRPLGLTFDAAGNLYVADWVDNRVRKVSPGGIITTAAGIGKPGFSGDDGKATEAEMHDSGFVVVDGAGNLFITDSKNHRVRKVTPEGIITTYAGSGPVETTTDLSADPQKGRFSGDNGPATAARLNLPGGLAVDALGNLFIADTLNYRVRRVTPEGMIATVAGTGADRSSGDGGLATRGGIAPVFLASDAGGNLFISDSEYNRVRKLTPDGVITTVAGTGQAGFSGDGGKATDAQLNVPTGLAVDSAGNLFISDRGNHRVRKVSPDGIIATIAGNGEKPYAGDGTLATETGLRGPLGLAIDAAGNLYIVDNGYLDQSDGLPPYQRVLKVIGVAAPGLIAGMPFPQ